MKGCRKNKRGQSEETSSLLINPRPLRGRTEDTRMTSVVGEWRMTEKDHPHV